jgi:hypothetical protein
MRNNSFWLFFFRLIAGESDGTENPIRRWTGVHFFTEPGDDDGLDLGDLGKSEMWKESIGFGSPGMKSTRHLPPQSKQSDNLNRNFFNYRSPTSATIQVQESKMHSTVGEYNGFFHFDLLN